MKIYTKLIAKLYNNVARRFHIVLLVYFEHGLSANNKNRINKQNIDFAFIRENTVLRKSIHWHILHSDIYV